MTVTSRRVLLAQHLWNRTAGCSAEEIRTSEDLSNPLRENPQKDNAKLRALSSGGSVISPPLSPALPKYKLADYRYGREEMLALYVKDNKVPFRSSGQRVSAYFERGAPTTFGTCSIY
ncbi:unnamed protein product [Ranitomeya imitator]|uniref:Uncharacterized protein n=1 Tax=Ranitomeya imitator TaxID=111125 RepID=A0ABN9MNS5_9NEOB|nr:unnamed protein product [Ranitomeya imitator]